MFETPILDPRNEESLTAQAKNHAFQRSEGVINDFSEAGALDTLIRTQAFTHAELLSYVNRLPLAVALRVLEFAGVEKREGSKATTIVRFQLIAPAAGLFTIPKGFEVQSSVSGNLRFVTTEILEIAPGERSGDVRVDAVEIGEAYNVASGEINRFITPLSGLLSVTNLEAAKGGTSAETQESIISRSIQAIRRRAPISVIDYQDFAEVIMGGGLAKCIPALALDKNSSEPGAAHVFLLAPDGTPATQALLNKVQSELGAQVHLGTKLYTSPMELFEVDGYINAQLLREVDPDEAASALWEAFRAFFSADRFSPGEAIIISELQTELRLATGLKYIELVEVNESAIPIPLPNDYTMPQPMSLRVDLVTATGAVFRKVKGQAPAMDEG